MPREYLPYAVIETAFIFTDHRYLSLPPLAKLIYITTWCRAFNERRSTLPPHVVHPSATARDTGIDLRTTRKYVQLLHDRGLTILHEDGSITIPGVRGKSNLRWKDDTGEGESITPIPEEAGGKTKTQTRQEGEGGRGIERGKGSRRGFSPGGKKPTQYTLDFDSFWTSYPHGSNRGTPSQTFRNWKRLLKEGIEAGDLLKCADNYAEEIRIKQTEPTYIFKASNFIGQARHFETFMPGEWTPPQPKEDNSFGGQIEAARKFDREMAEKEALDGNA